MAPRFTSKDAQRRFRYLCAIMGKRVCTSYNDVGSWTLDHAYGGWKIEEISSESGGVSEPFGSRRRKTTEFCEWTYTLAEGIELGVGMDGNAMDERRRAYFAQQRAE